MFKTERTNDNAELADLRERLAIDRRSRVAAEAAANVRETRLLDIPGTAKYLGVSSRSVHRLIETGAVPIVRLPFERARNGNQSEGGASRKILIDRRDLDLLIERSKEQWG